MDRAARNASTLNGATKVQISENDSYQRKRLGRPQTPTRWSLRSLRRLCRQEQERLRVGGELPVALLQASTSMTSRCRCLMVV